MDAAKWLAAAAATRSVRDNGVAVRSLPYQGVASVQVVSETLPEPLKFMTNVSLTAAPTGVTTTFNFTGYEEEL